MKILVTGGAGFIGSNFIFYELDKHPGDRIVCPGVFPKERREEDAGKEWLDIIHKDSFDGGHIVLDVPKGGKDYSITYLTAADESMKVLSVMNFRS